MLMMFSAYSCVPLFSKESRNAEMNGTLSAATIQAQQQWRMFCGQPGCERNRDHHDYLQDLIAHVDESGAKSAEKQSGHFCDFSGNWILQNSAA